MAREVKDPAYITDRDGRTLRVLSVDSRQGKQSVRECIDSKGKTVYVYNDMFPIDASKEMIEIFINEENQNKNKGEKKVALDFSHTTMIGRLTGDPELQTINGTEFCKINIANNYSYRSGNEKKEEVLFLECTSWGKQAKLINDFVKKGKRVLVSGRLRQSSWQAQDGTKRSKITLAIETIQFLDYSNNDRSDNQNIASIAEEFASMEDVF